MWISLVTKNSSNQSHTNQSRADQFLDPKLLDPVGIGIKPSNFESHENFRRKPRKHFRRTKPVVVFFFFVYEPRFLSVECGSSLDIKTPCCVDVRDRVWSPRQCLSSGPREHRTNRGAWKTVSQASKPIPLPLNKPTVSLVSTLYLWQRDLGLINWWNISCQCNTNTGCLK